MSLTNKDLKYLMTDEAGLRRNLAAFLLTFGPSVHEAAAVNSTWWDASPCSMKRLRDKGLLIRDDKHVVHITAKALAFIGGEDGQPME